MCHCVIPIPTVMKTPVPETVGGQPISRHYCESLASRADSDSVAYLTTGILFGLASAAGIVVGNTIGPDTSPDASWLGKSRNSLITSASAILAVPSTLLLMRSNSASTASAQAGDAMKFDNPKDAYNKCIDVRSTLVSSRSEVSSFAQKQVGANNINELQAAVSLLKKDYDDKLAAAGIARTAGSSDAEEKQKAADDAKVKLDTAKRKLDAAIGLMINAP